MITLILSDVHLDASERGRERMAQFAQYLRDLRGSNVKRLIVLGDLFDFWFEYRHVIFSGYFEVLRAFAELRDQGVELHLVCGNHDFWSGRFLRDYLDFTIYPDWTLMDFGGRRVLLAHGDGLNAKDWPYRLYKPIARARPIVWLFSLLHPDWAMALAQRVSRTSRRMANKRNPAKGSEARALRAFAAGTLERGDADVVLLGHAHDPVHEVYPTPNGSGQYINAGDWMVHRSQVEWDGSAFRLYCAGKEVSADRTHEHSIHQENSPRNTTA